MSIFSNGEENCPICANSVTYATILSYHMFFKPRRMSDRTIPGLPDPFFDRRVCDKCGLVYEESVKVTPQLRELIESEAYRTCRGHIDLLKPEQECDSACLEYYRLGMVLETLGRPLDAAKSYLVCANKAMDTQEQVPQLCYREILRCYEGQRLSLDERMIRLDLLRRSEQWRAARLAALHPPVLIGKYTPMALAQLRWIRQHNAKKEAWVDWKNDDPFEKKFGRRKKTK